MKKLGILLTVIVLALATVMSMAASPDREPARGTPIPIMPAATPTPVIVKPLDSSGRYNPEDMEELRGELLDLANVLDELYPFAEYYAQVSGAEPPPRVDRQLIREITPDGLYMLREALGGEEEVESFLDNIRALETVVLTLKEESSEGEKGLQPSLDSLTTLSAPPPDPPLTSIGIIPAPTPVTSRPPRIRHADHDQTNEDAGDLEEPEYFVLCSKTRNNAAGMLAAIVIADVAKAAAYLADIITCENTLIVIALPFGGGTNIPGCVAAGVVKGIGLAGEAVIEGLQFCDDTIDEAELFAAFDNTVLLHAELEMHDDNLTTRFNWTDKFLFDFRNLNLRSRIEDNLASPEDDPIALFTLPGDICITTDLEVISADNPKFSSGRIAGCGLLEVVSDTVRSAIDMNQIAGQDINNAEAEFDAAVQHYNNGEWKLAYARFRKAYREAVRP
jgi:hypothetical protein